MNILTCEFIYFHCKIFQKIVDRVQDMHSSQNTNIDFRNLCHNFKRATTEV